MWLLVRADSLLSRALKRPSVVLEQDGWGRTSNTIHSYENPYNGKKVENKRN